ncbi:MAG TPA: FAD-binding oxidoreductase [Bacteroidales bacterium]|nr:FAD-binding oxidoreductase [Bacteroidales bacterium]
MQTHTVSRKQITFNDKITEGVYLISFKRDFSFKAGQVIGISTEKDGPRRLYSICSGENDHEVQILYNIVDEGYLTPRLSELKKKDAIWITAPRGEFLYDSQKAFWIANGTGIAPFYSMFKSGHFYQKILIHGERYLNKFYFYDELHEAFGDKYIRCCSSEEDHGIYHGRVTDYLRSISTLPLDHKYYLCGRAEMVVESRDILIERNIPFNQIFSEIYF